MRSFLTVTLPWVMLTWMTACCLVAGDPRAFAQTSSNPNQNPTPARFSTTPTKSVEIEGIPFTLPSSLQLTKVAGEPLIRWPVVADWDSAGRLVVVESGGVGRPIAEHNRQQLHRVVRLSDQDGDGRFDTRQVAAEQLPFTAGILAIDNVLLVSAPPQILKLTDQDGDGVCESREVWFDGKTITGCANDLHGPYLGRDGWIYWCKGAFAEQTHPLLTGGQLVSSAAHIFRRRLNGGALEVVVTGGMDNPTEVAFLPSGEGFFTSTFLRHPGNGLRDGIAHIVHGGLYGKEHGVLDGHLRTGDLMPITIQLGAAAPSGLTYLESTALTDQLFPPNSPVLAAALFNLHQVTFHHLTPAGAGFHSQNLVALASQRVDFHPTDVLEDGQGGLIVLDTGGWYDLCCPSSRVDQKTAAGGIYRLSPLSNPNSAANSSLPNATISQRSAELATSDDVHELIQLAAEPHPIISRQAMNRLQQLGDLASPTLIRLAQDSATELRLRTTCVWVLCQIETPDALTGLSELLAQPQLPSETLTATAHTLGLHRFQPAEVNLCEQLTMTESGVAQAAIATALGRLKHSPQTSQVVVALLDTLAAAQHDRALEHALLLALLQRAKQPPTEADRFVRYLQSGQPHEVRAALFVLQQVRPEALQLATLLQLLSTAQDDVKHSILAILASENQRPLRAADQLALKQAWQAAVGNPRLATGLQACLRGWGNQSEMQTLIVNWLGEIEGDRAAEVAVIMQILRGFPGASLPAAWQQPLSDLLASLPATTAVELANWLRPLTANLATDSPLSSSLLGLARERIDQPRLALPLLAALPRGQQIETSALAQAVLDALLSEPTFATAEQAPAIDQPMKMAASVLQRVRLPVAAREHLLTRIEEISPLDLAVAIEALAVDPANSPTDALIDKLASLPTARTLPATTLRAAFAQHSPEIRQRVETLIDALQTAPADIVASVNDTLSKLPAGDALAGLNVFRSERAACSACHQLGYIGANIGPDLSRIATSRTRAQILEAILYPNARLEQSYQPTQILTIDGRLLTGLIQHESSNRIDLITGANQVVTLDPADVEERSLSEVSIMPAGLADQLTAQELADLLKLLSDS
ncbi:DUF7133 domain-containing protein [Planctomycetaceae bacterium SH139]